MANGNNGVKRRLSAVERAIVEDRKRRQEFEAWQRKTDRRLAQLMSMIQENQRAIKLQGEAIQKHASVLDRHSLAIETMQKHLHRLLER